MPTETINTRQSRSFLDHAHRAVSQPDLSEALQEIAGVLSEDIREGFETETDPGGSPWTQWVFRQLGVPDSKPTLVSSGRLKASVQSGGPDHIEQITGTSLVYGTSVPYAATHQEGGQTITDVPLVSRSGHMLPAGSALNIPARPFLGWSEEVLDQAADIIGRHVLQQIDKG